MAFDKKAYNRAYYEAHKEYWQNRNGVGSRRRNTIGSAVQDRINAMGGNAEVDYNSRKRRTLLTPGYKQNPTQNTTRTNPGYKVNQSVETRPTTAHNHEPYKGKKISTTDWDYVNKKRDAAYADASYKSNRRRTKTYSPTVSELAQYHRDADRRKMDIAKANYNRRNAESARSYAVGKSTLRSESKPKSGVIPRALRSYGSYYKIGVKSIGNSLSNAPKKVQKKLSNFYKKWLKW